MTYTTIRPLSSWRSIDCDQPLSAFVVCEKYYKSENEAEIYGEYDVKLNETKDNSSGFISITTGCICHAEEIYVAWFYKVGAENYPFRSLAQQGYFRTYTECHLDCRGLQAAVLSTGFYYTELADGIPVYLYVNLSNSFYQSSIKAIVSNRVYKIKDEIQQQFTLNTYSTWSCGNGEYVSILARCNGYVECSNLQDELDCESDCTNDHFQCTDGRCIHVSQLCDFTTDCLDGADEYCDEGVCSSETSFRCPEGRCLPLAKRCDGYKDCLDGSDEILCQSCNSTKAFQCRDKTCILHRLKCDKHKDCKDGSDEEMCTDTPFKSCDDVWAEGHTESGLYIIDEMEVKCEFDKNFTNMTFLHPDWECFETTPHFEKLKIHPVDSVKHAAREGYDCSLKISRVLKRSERVADLSDGAMTSATYRSTFNQFEFNVNNATLDKSGLVDFTNTLLQYSLRPSPPVFCDAAAESTQHDHVCIYTTDDSWKSGACRSMKHLSNCESFVCGPGLFKCPESYCIPQKFVCDGIKHCNGNEDESQCQLCNSIKSTRIIAGIDYNDIMGGMEMFSLHNIAKLWNSKLVLFQKLPKKNGDNEQEIDAYLYDTILTRSRVNCTKHEDSCIKNILVALNATNLYRELIWVETRSLPLKDTPFPDLFSSFNRSWKIVIDPTEQYPMKINHGSISEIRVQSMGLLRTIGPDILFENCTGNLILFFALKKCLCIPLWLIQLSLLQVTCI
ncbi:low-density lipoprotein receptor-related protein 1-like [Ruditapes philippinarum]|uniref:low-density lipoprotein receptor-related protein 1-like n=1 Tax=Ruditapes philippinarum TaxID=129788 RepID=UPI00295ADF4A|nr:low-density lipoprotein receptor-related protein 1-like [Ruditapes philippinarum]